MNRRYLLVIATMMTMTLLVSNTLDTKVFTLFGLNLPAGIILFPAAYIAADCITEVYGYAASRRVIWSSLAALVVMIVAYEIARRLPPASFWTNQAAFDAIFSHVPRIVVASMIAYVAGEFTNSFVLARMKVKTEGRGMAGRFVASTMAGQAVDTTAFVAVAYLGMFPNGELPTIIISAWLVKVGWEVLALPITLPVVNWLKRAEREDHFDRDTNFNPFRV